MELMVVCWCYRMPHDANGCISMLMNVTFYGKCYMKAIKMSLNVVSIK